MHSEGDKMEESSTYQHLMAIGPIKAYEKGLGHGARWNEIEAMKREMHSEARRMLLLAAEPKFGKPSLTVQIALDEIIDLKRLELHATRIHTSSSWDELLKPE